MSKKPYKGSKPENSGSANSRMRAAYKTAGLDKDEQRRFHDWMHSTNTKAELDRMSYRECLLAISHWQLWH